MSSWARAPQKGSSPGSAPLRYSKTRRPAGGGDGHTAKATTHASHSWQPRPRSPVPAPHPASPATEAGSWTPEFPAVSPKCLSRRTSSLPRRVQGEQTHVTQAPVAEPKRGAVTRKGTEHRGLSSSSPQSTSGTNVTLICAEHGGVPHAFLRHNHPELKTKSHS